MSKLGSHMTLLSDTWQMLSQWLARHKINMGEGG